jgi:uncharacterized membrane protein YkgB
MQMTHLIIFGLAFFAYALTRAPEKYRPTWSHRLNSLQVLIGIVAIIMVILIVMNPEFYALGVLGDSAFFDLLVLAISCQLQVLGSRTWCHFIAGFSQIMRFVRWRLSVICPVLLLTFAYTLSAIQKVIHRISC